MAAPRKTQIQAPTENILSVEKLVVDPTLNVRMRKGSNIYGVTVNVDGYDLATMIAQILERGKILEPIHVSLRKDSSYVVLRGNRRALAAQMLLNAPDTSDDVKKELHATRVLVYQNLTTEEERERVMDQNSKAFTRSEIVRYVWSLRQQGQNFERIAVDNFEMWGNFGRNARTITKLAQIRAIPENDIAERRKAIKTWLRGTVDEYVIPAYDLGPVVQKACILSEMQLDGLLTPTDEKPHFYTTTDPQKRMKLLGQAKEKDGSKWNPHLGGEAFNAQIEEFHKVDFPTPGGTVVVDATTKRPTAAQLKIHMATCKSSPARMAYSIALGNAEPEFISRDESLGLLEAKESLFLQFAENLKDGELKNILVQVFLKDNILDFKQMLEKHSTIANVVADEPIVQENTPKGEEADSTSEVVQSQTAEDGSFPLS